MNLKKAKTLRKQVFGDMALRQRWNYLQLESGQVIVDPDSLRAKYQMVKRAWKSIHCSGKLQVT